MRNLKFRALLDSGKWIYLTIHPGHRKFEGGSDEYVGEAKLVTPWLQNSGLKDKNGKEIFEGDILLHEMSKSHPGVKPFFEVKFEIEEWCEDGFFTGILLQGTSDQYEVIGNIYENPELLNQSNPPKDR